MSIYELMLVKTSEVFRESEEGFDATVLDRIAEATGREPDEVLSDYVTINQKQQ